VGEEQAGDCARVAASMLLLARLVPQQAADHDFADLSEASSDCAEALKSCAALLQVDKASLVAALTTRSLTLGSADDESVSMPLTIAEACENRDALIAHVHRIVFGWVSARADDALIAARHEVSQPPAGRGGRVISLVELPSLSRREASTGSDLDLLCAGLCHEKQRAFLLEALGRRWRPATRPQTGQRADALGSTEMSLCASKAARACAAASVENAAVLQLLEGRLEGVIPTIERHARLTVAEGDGDLCAVLSAHHARTPRWKLTPSAFVVRHSGHGEPTEQLSDGDAAGWREYQWRGLISADKAYSRPLAEISRLMRTSTSCVVRQALELRRGRDGVALNEQPEECLSFFF